MCVLFLQTTMNWKDALTILRGVSKKMIKDRQEYEEKFCGYDLQLAKQEIEAFFTDDYMLDIPTQEDLLSEY